MHPLLFFYIEPVPFDTFPSKDFFWLLVPMSLSDLRKFCIISLAFYWSFGSLSRVCPVILSSILRSDLYNNSNCETLFSKSNFFPFEASFSFLVFFFFLHLLNLNGIYNYSIIFIISSRSIFHTVFLFHISRFPDFVEMYALNAHAFLTIANLHILRLRYMYITILSVH